MDRLSCFLVLYSGLLFASPEGMRVLKGEVEQDQGIISTKEEKTILEWDRFSMEKGESLHFRQPNENSSVLNRVTGAEHSEIHGLLSSNGALYLLNPNGILIGPEGRIDTAGFIASSLDLLNEDFLANRHAFSQPGPGEIVNLGTVHCSSGNIALIGRKVQNTGLLEAPQGNVGLGVGQEIFLQLKDHPYMLIRAGLFADEQQEAAAIVQSGRIQALKVELRTSSNAYQKAIQTSGIIDALSIEERNGEIYLVADKGIVDVTGSMTSPGGTVHLLSDKIGLFDQACIDVSGKLGGGTILVGGDFQGKNPDIPSAEAVFAGKDTVLKADALEKGNGGKVILWSETVTRHYGQISAQGGVLGGNGGLVEVSGKQLDFEGTVRLAAPKGKTGTLLLDPTNITISTGGDSGGSFSGCSGGINTFTASGTSNTINTITLVNNLQNPCDVTISTASGDGSAGTIIVSNAVSWNTASKLTLISNSTTTINASITSTSTDTTVQDAIVVYASGGLTANNGVTISAAGSRGITLVGTGTSGVGCNFQPTVTVSTVDGQMTLFGQTGTNGNGFLGVRPVISSTGTGNITVTGISGATAGFIDSVLMIGGTWSVKDGTLTVYGTATGAATATSGVSLCAHNGGNPALTVSITGTGSILLKGTSATAALGYGVLLGHYTGGLTSSTTISGNASSGPITIYGLASTGSTAGNSGFMNAGAVVGGSTTPTIVINGTSRGTGNNSMGIAMINGDNGSNGTLQVGTNGSLTLIGTGAGSTSASNNHGISLANGSFTGAGTITLGSGATCTLSGTGGGGTSGSNYGVNLATGTFTMTGGNQTVTFQNCSGGSGGNNNRGVHIGLSLVGTATSSSITFDNVQGGSSGSSSYGVYIPTGVTVQAGVIQTFNSSTRIIKGGSAAADSNFGLYVNAGTLQANSTTTLSSITAYAVAGSTNAVGVKVDSAGTIKTTGAGGLTITGSGSLTGTGSANYGFYATGASTTLSTTSTGPLTINGTAGAGTTNGIFLDTTPVITSSAAASISLNTGFTTQNIGLSTSTFTLASGSSITFGSPVILSTSTQTITASGTGNISFNSTIDGAQTVNLTVGTGAITLNGAVGGTTRLSALGLSGSSGTLNLGANVSLNNSSFAPAMPTILTGNSTINTGATGGAITFSGVVNDNSSGAHSLSLQAGNGIVTFGSTIGATTPIGALTVSTTDNTPASGWIIGGNISCSSLASTGVTNKITLTAGSTITASSGSISFGTSTTAVDGAQALSLFATTAAQSVTLASAIGSNTALTSLTVNSPTITQSSTVRTSANVSYTASTAVQLGGNITTTSPGSISFTTPATNLTTGVTLDTTNGGNNNGAAISFSSTINNAQALTLRAGSSGAITFGGAVGTSGTPLASITFTSGNSLSLGGNVFLNNSAFQPGMPVKLANSVTINTGGTGGAITFSGALNGTSAGSQNLTLLAGNGVVTFGSAVGATTALGVLNVQSGSSLVVQASINCSTGTWAPPMTITDVINVTTQ